MHYINFYETLIKLKIIICVKTNSAQDKQESNPDLFSESEHHFSRMNGRALTTGMRPTLPLPVSHPPMTETGVLTQTLPIT